MDDQGQNLSVVMRLARDAGIDETAIRELTNHPRALALGGDGALVVAKGHEDRVQQHAPEFWKAWARAQRPGGVTASEADRVTAAIDREREIAAKQRVADAKTLTLTPDVAKAKLAELRAKPLGAHASDAQRAARAYETETLMVAAGLAGGLQ